MTDLSRRRFFGLLGGAAATYFLPPIGGWKSDVIINPGEALFFLADGLFKPKIYTDWISVEQVWYEMGVDPFIMVSNIQKKLDKQLTTV